MLRKKVLAHSLLEGKKVTRGGSLTINENSNPLASYYQLGEL